MIAALTSEHRGFEGASSIIVVSTNAGDDSCGVPSKSTGKLREAFATKFQGQDRDPIGQEAIITIFARQKERIARSPGAS